MNTTSNSILKKIRNLLTMADPKNGATANEMEIALRKATELMTSHGVSAMDLGDPAELSEINRHEISTGRKRRDEDRWIPRVIAKVFDVQVLYTSRWDSSVGKCGGYRHVYVFVGEDLDVEIAKIALPRIYEAMKNGLNEHLRMRGIKWNTHTANSFFRGVADGFIKESVHGRQAAMRQFNKDQQDRFALVLVEKSKKISNWIANNMNTSAGRKSSSRAGNDAIAQHHGFQVGSALDFTTKLN